MATSSSGDRPMSDNNTPRSDDNLAYIWSESKFIEALKMVRCFFNIDELKGDQERALYNFFRFKKHIYYSAPTGHGKSLIFQSIPLIADVLADNLIGTSNILVISPLLSLMHDQIKYVNTQTGLSAAGIFKGQDQSVLADIENGMYSIIYASPESVLSSSRWRHILSGSRFADCCIGIAIDEAHCIKQWGESIASKSAFRKWFGMIGEIRSLLPKVVQMAVFTATATKATKHRIIDVSGIDMSETFVLEKSPVKENLRFTVKYVGNGIPLSEIFGSLVQEIKAKGIETIRTLIFCQTRNQAAVIWKMFVLELEENLYKDKSEDVKGRLVEMFHAGTPKQVKDFILEQMRDGKGHIRILLCTISFGMGIDCKGVHRSIHFGPSKNVENYLQECGRAGRDGTVSHAYLLYNGFTLSHSEKDMKDFISANSCRRSSILSNFPKSRGINFETVSQNVGCKCCDLCAKACSVSIR
eukprot:Seg6977.1 transcript_id=Seg6977.1/GoldUCD/mRNA.D3Y31 product="ATP-dependent DNA helicase RecQ" protein_id=Seg6977.1/GoldUCD/D3Y31